MRRRFRNALCGAVASMLAAQLAACAGALDGASVASGSASIGVADAAVFDEGIARLMAREHVVGMALAWIDNGRVARVAAYGLRDAARGEPLLTDTVMYGASLTKTAFAYLCLQLVDEGRLRLDVPIADLLPRPLPEYAAFADLAGDPRWRLITPRHVLEHATGLANFRRLEPDRRLRIHFDPGTRYAYSGEGFGLLQFALEEGLGIDVGRGMQERVFDRFGMARTAMTWRPDFAPNVARGYGEDGSDLGHARRRSVQAIGSMDTTIADQARFWAGLVRGDGLSAAARAEMVRAQLAITSAHQFPTLAPTSDDRNRQVELSAGLGVIVFREADGSTGWYKGGHDDGTGNIAICLERGRRCVVMLGNDVRAERIYPEVARRVLGPTAMRWVWEYGAFVPR